MPLRPANISGGKDALQTVNQSLREINTKFNSLSTQINNKVTATPTVVVGTVNAHSSVAITVPIYGAVQSSTVQASPSGPLDSGHQLGWSAAPSANGQIRIIVSNPTTGNITANTVQWNISVFPMHTSG